MSSYNTISRPNILVFNDYAWNSRRSDNQEKRYRQLLRKIGETKKRVFLIEVGAGTAVPTIGKML